MKKTFPLTSASHKPARVVEQVKSEVRKYIKRERKKPLAEGIDFCDFACRTGESAETAAPAHVAELNEKIDAASEADWAAIYIEILAKPGYRTAKAKSNA